LGRRKSSQNGPNGKSEKNILFVEACAQTSGVTRRALGKNFPDRTSVVFPETPLRFPLTPLRVKDPLPSENQWRGDCRHYRSVRYCGASAASTAAKPTTGSRQSHKVSNALVKAVQKVRLGVYHKQADRARWTRNLANENTHFISVCEC